MKKLILSLIICIPFSLYAESNIEHNLLIANNYNWITAPIYIPNSKHTIKQIITTTFLDDKKITHASIESNTDGLIEKVLINDESMSIDYGKKKLHYSGIDATIELDNNYVTAVFDKNNEKLASLSYNNLGQFVKIEDINPLTKEKRIQAFGYYNNKTVQYFIKEEKFFYKIKMFYNQKEELIKSIIEIYIITDDSSKTHDSPEPDLNIKRSDREIDNLTPRGFICIYSEHNEYGDWTSGYCMTGDGVKRSTFTRELEYE